MKNVILIIIAIISLTQFSCSRNSDTVGPDICPSESFKVVAGEDLSFRDNNNPVHTNGGTLDLSSSFAKINIVFSEAIDYKFILSAPSGAQFLYSGKGNTIDYSWYGNSTNGIFFQQNDIITCTVTNLCFGEPLGKSTLQLTSIISYNSGFGVKVANFEDTPTVADYGGMTITYPSPGDAEYVSSPQGGQYLKVAKGPTQPLWYFGGVGFTGLTSTEFAALGTDPNTVYLNFYAKGQANSQCQMIFKENVYGSSLSRKFLANVTSDWKLYSVKLSDIGIINPSTITNLDINLGAAQYMDTSAEIEVDLILFTLGAPL